MRQTFAVLMLGGAIGAVAIAAPAAASAVAPSVGTECTTVPYSWAGMASLAPGQSMSTGTIVPGEVGVQLDVAAFDVSTIDPAPGAIAVRIGDGAVANGATVAGGEIAATNSSGATVVVTRIELNLDRCFQVDSAGPVPVTDSTAAAAPVALPTMPPVPEGGLPQTGQASGRVLALGVLLTGAGLILVRASRRRSAARVTVRVRGR